MKAETAPPLTEKDFQRQVVELAKIRGWRVYHPFLSKWSEHGFPDLTMVRARDRRLLFAELKRDKAKTTPAQEEWQNLLGAVAFDPRQTGVVRLYGLPLPTIEVVVWRPVDWLAIEATLR
jgi:hypothetical protein